MNYSEQAEDIAARILAMPAEQQRLLLEFITDENHRQDAIERGDWSHYALQLVLREKYKIKVT